MVTIRPLRSADLAAVVAEHLTHFPDGFFAKLGPAFLTRYTARMCPATPQ